MGLGRDYCFSDCWDISYVPPNRNPLKTSKNLKNNPLAIVKAEKEPKMTDKTLYEIKDGFGVVGYGYKLAVNSQGQWVMEIKGSGQVMAVDKSNVTKVMPYTISVQYKDGGTLYHYFNEDRSLKNGDFFINTSTYEGGGQYQIGRVVDVDTKSDSAKVEIKYFKVL